MQTQEVAETTEAVETTTRSGRRGVRMSLVVPFEMAERVHGVAVTRRNPTDLEAFRWLVDTALDLWDKLPDDKKRPL